MTKDGEVQYEHQSVKVIRGREANKIAEMQNQRWELVSQTEGKLRTEMTFRRIKKPDYRTWIALAAFAAVAVFGFGLSAILGGGNEPEPMNPSTAASSAASGGTADDGPSEPPSEEALESATPTAEPSSELPTEEPTETPADQTSDKPAGAPPGDAVLTVQNSPDLKVLLNADDDYALNKAFTETYKGRKIQFDGSVADASPGYYLVYFGNDSDSNATSGPAFQFKVRTLHAGGRQVATGDNLRFTATVGSFNVDQGLFFLTPVTITAR